MSRKLHKFQTVAEYQAYSASTEYTTPCVALIVDTNVIYYDYGNNMPQVDMSNYKGEFQESSVGGDKFGRDAITKINYIPSGVTSLNSAFSNLTSLEEVTCKIPSCVTDMSDTFYACSSLVKSPEIQNSVTNLFGTFYNCKSLTTAPQIPNSVRNMEWTFCGCSSLKEVTFLHTTPPTYSNTLNDCPKLESIYVPDSAVEDYKAATNWSEFADKIKPLSSKPSE